MTRLSCLVFSVILACMGLAGCTPELMPAGPRIGPAVIAKGEVIADDGAHLPMRVWAAAEPRAVILGVHGFNDYSNAFDMPGGWFASRGVTLYAYDQRGFGQAPGRKRWAGGARMAKDLNSIISLLRARHPHLPLYLLGESMGGSVVMRLYAMPEPPKTPKVDGIILAAPAVWGWRSMNAFYETVLWVAAHIVPDITLTGRGLERRPSDNIDMLRGLGRDPLVIKKTRIGTIYGLVNLMDEAAAAAKYIKPPVLLLYGAHDEIVPAEPVATVLRTMREADVQMTAACYPNGWHMLLRDLQRETVWTDIAAWMTDHKAPLPSGAQDLRPCKAFAE